MDPLTVTSRLLGSAAMASGRPVATAFAVQAAAAWAIHGGHAALPPGLAWTTSPLALGIGFAAALLELFVQHTEGADEVIRNLHADKLVGALVSLPTMAVLASLTWMTADLQEKAVAEIVAKGVAPDHARALVDTAARELVERVGTGTGELVADDAGAEELKQAIELLDAQQATTGQKATTLTAAFLLQLAMMWLRGRLREFAEDMSFERLWSWLESGGLLAGTLLIAFAPVVLLVLTVGLLVAMLVGLLVLKLVSAAMDAARRRPCPACQAAIRVEASRCPRCRASVSPTKLLGPAPVAPLPAPGTVAPT